jgi:LL-diaminopimelate aminotransferase
MIRTADRLVSLPTYTVAELAATKRRLLAEGVDVVDLSAGDADFPPPPPAVEALTKAVNDPAMSRYAFQVGLAEFRSAAARYMQRRFGAEFDPTAELLPLLGSKDGLSHLPLAFVNPGEVCVLPDPGYPAYLGGALLAGADVELVPLTPERGFLVELGDLPPERLRNTRLVYLNYPNNPTTAVAPREYLQRTVDVCREYDILIAYDNPYAEITFDDYRSPSIFEMDGARDVALEFHSVSKSFCMTGWRLGWVAGAAEQITNLRKLKTWVDTGVFLAVQSAGAAVLDDAERLVQPLLQNLVERRDAAVKALTDVGLEASNPVATMYVWVRLPGDVSSATLARDALEKDGVALLPGTAFGRGGEGFFRIALTVGVDRLTEGIGRLAGTLQRLRNTG